MILGVQWRYQGVATDEPAPPYSCYGTTTAARDRRPPPPAPSPGTAYIRMAFAPAERATVISADRFCFFGRWLCANARTGRTKSTMDEGGGGGGNRLTEGGIAGGAARAIEQM